MKAELDIMDVVSGITTKVILRKTRQFKFRLWIGVKLIILASHIIGMRIEIEVIYEAGDNPDGATNAVFSCVEIEYV